MTDAVSGDASTDAKKEQDAGPATPFNASGDDGRGSAVKVRCPIFLFPIFATLGCTNVG